MAILPAGSFNTSKRVYTALKVGDVVEGGVEKVTRGLWSGNVGTLTTFFTSSAQSSTQKQYYYEIFNKISTDATSESQFSVTYGHDKGSGSLGQNEDSPSNAIYSQYAQILLPDNQRVFKFNNATSEHIYAININRARLKDRLDPGNFELSLAKLDGADVVNSLNTGSNVHVSASNEVIELIDDSGDTQQAATQIGRVYNLVSGSILNGVYSPKTYYEQVYPEQGVIVLHADTMKSSVGFGTVTDSHINGDNDFKLHTSISGSAVLNAINEFQSNYEVKVQLTYYLENAKIGC